MELDPRLLSQRAEFPISGPYPRRTRMRHSCSKFSSGAPGKARNGSQFKPGMTLNVSLLTGNETVFGVNIIVS